MKATRLGFSSVADRRHRLFCRPNDPSPILYLLPTEADCRGFLVDDVEPLFEASPALDG